MILRMNFTTIRRKTAALLLIVLFATFIWLGIAPDRIPNWIQYDWSYVFCVSQTIPLAAWTVFGPGPPVLRFPLALAWGLALGFALAMNNLIALNSKVSVAGGVILPIVGFVTSAAIYVVYGARTRATLAIGGPGEARERHRLSLRLLLLIMGAYAITATVARSVVNAPPYAYLNWETTILQAWLVFFPTIAASPALLFIFRPSWKIAIGVVLFGIIVLVEPFLFALVEPWLFNGPSPKVQQETTWSDLCFAWSDAFLLDGQTVVATVIYALLARAAGLRMVVPNQSSDKNPKPSAQPATDAGCVQD